MPVVTYNLPDGLKEKVDAQAKKESRSASNWVTIAINTALSSAQPGGEEIADVFEYWIGRMGKTRSVFTQKRKSCIRARLKEGYTVEEIKRAIDGCASSPHHMGQNAAGTVYDDLTLICRSGDKLEWFANNIAKVMPNEDAKRNPKSRIDRAREQTRRIFASAEAEEARSGYVGEDDAAI